MSSRSINADTSRVGWGLLAVRVAMVALLNRWEWQGRGLWDEIDALGAA